MTVQVGEMEQPDDYRDYGRPSSHVRLHRSLQTAPLIGRQTELALLAQLLGDPSVRLVSLVGRGGVGKTRLALELAWTLDTARAGSVAVVSLANVHDPDLLLVEVAAQLEMPTLPGQSLASGLVRRLGRFPLVLVLDNFEHLREASNRLNDLLDACDELQILVTSQAPLHLRAERVLRLAPLPLPSDLQAELADLAGQPSVALYCDRARAANDRFRLSAENASSVVALCRQLEGLPLAIELAAARATTLPAAEIVTRIAHHGTRVLRSHRHDAPARHQELRAAIGWTYRLLPAREQELLKRLSVIGAGFEIDDAEALCTNDADVVDGLSSLVDLHLVEAGSESDRARFELAPSIRNFALQELATSGDVEAIEGTWTAWLAKQARLATRGLNQTDPDPWWDWLERAHDRLLHALQVCLTRPSADQALDLLGALAPQWVNRALEPVHRQLLDRTIELAELEGETSRACAEGWIWSALLGIRMITPDRPALLVERLHRTEDLARSLGDDDLLLQALDCWARVSPVTGDLARATEAIAEGLALAGRLRATCWLARFEVHTASLATSMGDDERALAVGLAALAHAREAGDTTSVLQAALRLQSIAPLRPEAAKVLPPPDELLAMARKTHQTAIEGVLLPIFAIQAVPAGDVAAAAGWCRRTLELSGFDPSSFLTGYGMFAAVEIAAARGDDEVAARLHGRLLDSERLLYATIWPHFVAAHETVIGGVRDALGDDRFTALLIEGGVQAWASTLAELHDYLGRIEPSDPAAPRLTPARSTASSDGLTDRQRQVVVLLSRGLSNKEIARVLGVTPKTVMHHTVAIYQKLGARGRSETVAWAVRSGVAGESS